jgi:hypothetical protein
MSDSSLSKWQAIASIAASIAIPLVLAIFGFMVQRQLATEGLKKDYVQIAISILKENPSGQDKELRSWAVEVLDRNAEIPFSKGAKESLEKGFPLVRNQLFFPTPPEQCMKSPEQLQLYTMVKSTMKGEYLEIKDQKKFLLGVVAESAKAEDHSLRLSCLQKWIEETRKQVEEFNDKQYGLVPEASASAAKRAP